MITKFNKISNFESIRKYRSSGIPLGFLIGMLTPSLLYMLGIFITKKVISKK
jgi:hypothetical protein